MLVAMATTAAAAAIDATAETIVILASPPLSRSGAWS